MSREGSVLIWTDRKKRKKAKRLSCLMQLCKDHALDPYLHSLSEQKLYRHSKDVLIIRKIKAKGPNVKNISSRDVLPCGRIHAHHVSVTARQQLNSMHVIPTGVSRLPLTLDSLAAPLTLLYLTPAKHWRQRAGKKTTR